ncbi:MAG: hypothetical protein IT306_07045 [Chloroflexi bacterium]|nr:hypothetical protein [Chloroflexota bacterium]
MSSRDSGSSVATPAKPSGPDALAAAIDAVYAEVDRRLAAGSVEDVDRQAVQRLMTLAVKLYVAQRQAGAEYSPFVGDSATATDVTVTAMAMLEAVNLDVFELSLWRGWGKA